MDNDVWTAVLIIVKCDPSVAARMENMKKASITVEVADIGAM